MTLRLLFVVIVPVAAEDEAAAAVIVAVIVDIFDDDTDDSGRQRRRRRRGLCGGRGQNVEMLGRSTLIPNFAFLGTTSGVRVYLQGSDSTAKHCRQIKCNTITKKHSQRNLLYEYIVVSRAFDNSTHK